MDYTALSKRVADAFPRLSPQLQRAARHVLDRPDDVALMSMRKLAAGAGVHPSTMVRLARAFDFSSYNSFREPFQQRLRVRPAVFLERARDLQVRGAGGETPGLLQELLAFGAANLRETFNTNGAQKFMECAKALAKGRRIYVVGYRSCYPVAFGFHYALSTFRDDVVLLGEGGSSRGLRQFEAGDRLVAVSFHPYTFETVRAVNFAKDRGGTVVALTDSLVSPLAKSADHTLIIKNQGPSFFHSVAAAVAASEALIALMVAEGGKSTLASIEESERRTARFDTYWRKGSK